MAIAANGAGYSAFRALMLSICLVLPGLAFAGNKPIRQDVQFSSASVPPTPFEMKRAKAKGIELKAKPGDPLTGILRRPNGNGPFPAIILIHSCFGPQDYQGKWAEVLTNWGYVTLQVDSYDSRGIRETCSNHTDAFYKGVGSNNASDSYGALAFLQSQDFVDGENIALMGWGFSPVLSAVVTNGQQRYFKQKFKAAVAIYPYCKGMTSGEFYLPLAIHIGEEDDWTFAKECDKTALAAREKNSPVELLKHPGVYHSFDDDSLGEKQFFQNVQNIYSSAAVGAHLGYNKAAHEKTRQSVERFLQTHLK